MKVLLSQGYSHRCTGCLRQLHLGKDSGKVFRSVIVLRISAEDLKYFLHCFAVAACGFEEQSQIPPDLAGGIVVLAQDTKVRIEGLVVEAFGLDEVNSVVVKETGQAIFGRAGAAMVRAKTAIMRA